MALRVSPERVRDVRFAEQWRGYRTDEVDEFVEQVAEAFDQLEGRLEEAAQRTALAERRLEERGPEEDLRRTLVLAQRTADAALEEARAEATRLVADAEDRARSMLDHLEERKARIEGEIDARIAMELAQLSDRRAALEADVELLESYVGNQRSRLVQELRAHLAWLEGAGPLASLPAALSGPLPPAPAPVVAAVPRPEAQEPPCATSDRDAGEEVDGESAAIQTPSPPAAPEASTGEDGRGGDGAEEQGGAHVNGLLEDGTALDDLDVIPWGGASDDEEGAGTDDVDAAGVDDDPFIAELRRAVDDPEPLGPRDEPAERRGAGWGDDVDLYDRHQAGPMRSRRRRRP